MATFQGLKRP
jgi:hypothetical protein